MQPTSIKQATSILVGLSVSVTVLSRKNKLSAKNGFQNMLTVDLSFLYKWCITLHTPCCKGMVNYNGQHYHTVKYLSHICRATWLAINGDSGFFYLWANIADLNIATGFYYIFSLTLSLPCSSNRCWILLDCSSD